MEKRKGRRNRMEKGKGKKINVPGGRNFFFFSIILSNSISKDIHKMEKIVLVSIVILCYFLTQIVKSHL